MNNESGGVEDWKKLDHNAKERIRRMKLNASFLALRALLPNSSRSKKRWSAPAIVDKVLKYIPEVEKEVEELRRTKENLISEAKGSGNNGGYENPTISLNRVSETEATLQVCVAIQDDEDDHYSQFINLLQAAEDESITINAASALHISHTRICHQLHIQIDNTSRSDHLFQELMGKADSWFR